MYRTTTLLLVAAASLALTACAGEPPVDPGRPRPAFRYAEREMFILSEEVYADLRKREPLVAKGDQRAQLLKVGDRVARATYHDYYAWSFALIDAPQRARATCLPGGKVVVYSGLFKLVQSADDLAVVLSHAIAHATLRHANERLSAGKPALPKRIVKGAWAGAAPETRTAVLNALGLTGSHDATLRREADDVCLAYLRRAGFPLTAAAAFWKRVAQAKSTDLVDRAQLGKPGDLAARAARLSRRAREIHKASHP